jgi:hypothetical protein
MSSNTNDKAGQSARRRFLKAGLTSAASLAAVGVAAQAVADTSSATQEH